MPIPRKHRVWLFSLLRFFDKFFDVVNDDPFLMMQIYCANLLILKGNQLNLVMLKHRKPTVTK